MRFGSTPQWRNKSAPNLAVIFTSKSTTPCRCLFNVKPLGQGDITPSVYERATVETEAKNVEDDEVMMMLKQQESNNPQRRSTTTPYGDGSSAICTLLSGVVVGYLFCLLKQVFPQSARSIDKTLKGAVGACTRPGKEARAVGTTMIGRPAWLGYARAVLRCGCRVPTGVCHACVRLRVRGVAANRAQRSDTSLEVVGNHQHVAAARSTWSTCRHPLRSRPLRRLLLRLQLVAKRCQ